MESVKEIHVDTLCDWLNVTPRVLRRYSESYNSFCYIGVVPKGQIRVIKGTYTWITPNHDLKRYYQLRNLHDLICFKIKNRASNMTLGKIQVVGQMSIEDIENINDIDELMRMKDMIEGELENV